MRRPVAPNVPITQNYGKTSFSANHNGIDWSGRFDRTVCAPESGTLGYQWQPTMGGNVLTLKAGNREHRLAHLSSMVKKSGSVSEGQVIGVMGATGQATAVHLHSGLLVNGKYVNPMPYYDAPTPLPKPPSGVSSKVMDSDDGTRLYQVALHRNPESAAASQQWNGLKPGEAMRRLQDAPEWKANDAKVKGWDNLVGQLQRAQEDSNGKISKAAYDALMADFAKEQEKVVALEAKAAEEAAKSPVTPTPPKSNWLADLLNSLFRKRK